MTTRKALIGRIQSMQLGTQEMLDAAKDDATLIPFNTLFASSDGYAVWRIKNIYDDQHSVHMAGVFVNNFYDASDLFSITEE